MLIQRPRIISRHYWRPPGKGVHKPNRVLTVHADPCLSALTESEPLVRTGAPVGCHCHNGSGFAPTVMLIFIARPFPGVVAYGCPRLAGLLPTPILLHTYALLFNCQIPERSFFPLHLYTERKSHFDNHIFFTFSKVC